MYKLALTGPTGSGKTYLCGLFEERGVPSLDTDRVVHDLYADPAFAALLAKKLQADILAPDGTVDSEKLRNLLFGNTCAMKKMSAVVYPEVRKVCLSFLENAEKKGAFAALVDAPQLFEAGFEGDYDMIIALVASKKLRIQRIRARDGITVRAAQNRMAHQMSAKEYSSRADVTIRNDGKSDLSGSVDGLLASLDKKGGKR